MASISQPKSTGYPLSYEVVHNSATGEPFTHFGPDPKSSLRNRYHIVADFGDGKCAAFHLSCKSLQVALEMIHYFGQQVKEMNRTDFFTYLDSVAGKRFYCDIQENPRKSNDVIRSYTYNRTGTALEDSKIGVFTVTKPDIDFMRDHAKRLQERVDRELHETADRLRVILQERVPAST